MIEFDYSECFDMEHDSYKAGHAISILSGLDKDRKSQQLFCDAVVNCESRSFVVHKCVVTAASDYFHKLFSSKMKETYESKVDISSVSADTLEIILDYIYTGDLILSDDNVYEIVCAADYLQMQDLKNFCSCFLNQNISEENCFIMWNFAKLYRMDTLNAITELFISANFFQLIKSKEYMQLNVDQMKEFIMLQDDSTSQITIYNTVIDWLKHDSANKSSDFAKLFACIQFGKLPIEFLKETVSKEDLIFNSSSCARMLVEAVCERIEVKEAILDKNFIAVGGTPSEYEVFKLNVNTNELVHLPSLTIPRSGASVVVASHQLFVLGGHSYTGDSSKSYSSVVCLNLNNDLSEWTEKASMITPRRCAGCVLLDGFIYMCGGKAHDTHWLESCEKYNIVSNNWVAIEDMNCKRSEFGMVTVNGRIYAIGGSNRPHSYLNSVECFDPNISSWNFVSNLNIARARFAAAASSDEIFVIGGESNNRYLDSVEKYSPELGTWLFAAVLSESRFNHSACVFGKEIYIFGGNTKVEFYDILKNEWNTKLMTTRKIGSAIASL